MSRRREWKAAINSSKTKKTASTGSSSDEDLRESSSSSCSRDVVESRGILRGYSEEEAASLSPVFSSSASSSTSSPSSSSSASPLSSSSSSSNAFLKNVLSNTIMYSIQNRDVENTKLLLSHYVHEVDFDLQHSNWVSVCLSVSSDVKLACVNNPC